MMILFLVFSILTSWAKVPQAWNHIASVSDQHEFYKNFEPITKPQNSWQLLFSLSYIDSDLNTFKDCVFYRVPGVDLGALKIKTLSSSDKCEDHLLNPGEIEIKDIKLLQYSIFESKINLEIGYKDLKTEKWSLSIPGAFKRPETKIHLSSAEFKAPKILFLAPKVSQKSAPAKNFLKKGTLCLDVNDECEIKGSMLCNQCEEGWYEFPNGCSIGPKYCGRLECGGKDHPACRKGMKWQRKEENFDCRADSSFAYCSKGLSVQCEGKKAFCR